MFPYDKGFDDAKNGRVYDPHYNYSPYAKEQYMQGFSDARKEK